MNAALNPLLLKALAGSGTGGASPQELLMSQLGEQDPTVAMLAQYLTQGSDDDDDDNDEADAANAELEAAYTAQTEAIAAYEEKLHHVTEITRHLHQKLKDVYAELQDLRERNDLLAAALGACHLCWGEDRDCEVCRGEGYPGFYRPDADMFRQYATPALARLQRSPSAQPRSPSVA